MKTATDLWCYQICLLLGEVHLAYSTSIGFVSASISVSRKIGPDLRRICSFEVEVSGFAVAVLKTSLPC